MYNQVPLLMNTAPYRGPTPTVEAIMEGTSGSVSFLILNSAFRVQILFFPTMHELLLY